MLTDDENWSSHVCMKNNDERKICMFLPLFTTTVCSDVGEDVGGFVFRNRRKRRMMGVVSFFFFQFLQMIIEMKQ